MLAWSPQCMKLGALRRNDGSNPFVAAEDTLIKRTFWYVVSIAILHALGVALLLPLARANPALLGMGFLAYTLGLRHAFDADHIAAIDNTVRKLVRQDRSSQGVGFYFSLGHS